ncbi:SMI1/KNR4 family protein [Pseudoduganella sp. SL102]|uniref:SMI1/KNR4 family protein n=1 Tax=Pseudoduganella sp. SL102 TaxID=2995154 RepID=UPI00248B5A66|nr:SMI1/KNR4 family protein [Pseudoduganella sp. SL102]WBS02565.1 SMI1/KNR4 family protein [Pseudoduganella sp. SL102]
MEIKFESFGMTQEKLDQLGRLGLKYDKRQKKQMLAAANVKLPTAENIGEFEKKIGFTLPSDYKEFLLRQNGGIPDRSLIKIPSLGKKVVQSLFALVNPVVAYTVDHNLDLYKNRMPQDMLPVANDPAGNLYIMKVGAGGDFGNIYFWNHELEADGEKQPYLENITYIANSFNDFLLGLK